MPVLVLYVERVEKNTGLRHISGTYKRHYKEFGLKYLNILELSMNKNSNKFRSNWWLNMKKFSQFLIVVLVLKFIN